LTLNIGVRYDLQTFEAGNLITNPLYLPSGKIPTISHNVSPRFGFAYAVGEHRSLAIRGGFGLFYMQIPSMYASQVATDNGITQGEIFLDNMIPSNAAVFPSIQPLW
jgi:outer membrane receptor protein involved in Fe transport